MSRRWWVLSFAAAAVLFAATASLASSQPGRTGARVAARLLYVAPPVDSLVYKPRTISLAADAAEVVYGLKHWHGWGGRRAKARGRESIDLCRPDCASGKRITHRVTVTLLRRRRLHGQRAYLCTGIRPVGRAPKEFTASRTCAPRQRAVRAPSAIGRTAAAAVIPVHASAAHCGSLRAHYREHGTSQFVAAITISALRLSCRRARRVARDWAHHSRLSGRPASKGAGFRCRYIRAGSDVGRAICHRGRRIVRFNAYDSSPFH